MILTDTHTHLYLEQFNEDIDATIARAHNDGVERIFLPNINSETVEPMLELSNRFEGIYPMIGLHPCDVKENVDEELAVVKAELDQRAERGYVAIGEIGMDLYWDKTFQQQQVEALHQQCQWAKETGLPIVLHTRDAFDEIFEVIDAENDDQLSGIFHCFTGTVEQAQHILSYGNFYLGIGGVLTYKKANLGAVLSELPLEKMVLETDAPYLTPVPFRGKRNEASYVKYVAEKLAEVKGVSVEEVARITTENSKAIFKV